ncbi:DNA methyltransferase 1-associated protein 1 isoform X1 [Halyomorpha halys]|uniref:DNA methyltransferase 1-associated protein 1 isoform X1 n=1 Tax=Halyomorpha halys TaxID=286706 RepID=UPI0034D1D273
MLQTELRKIEARKKERDRKTQDLQKLITAADNQEEPKKTERKFPRKKFPFSKPRMDNLFGELSGIKFPDIKGSGVTLRSQRMKFPTTIGQKKMKAIEQQLTELNIDLNPLPTEEICQQFNDLRSDVYLLCELKAAISTCEFEIQSLRHQYEAVNPSKQQDYHMGCRHLCESLPGILPHPSKLASKLCSQICEFYIFALPPIVYIVPISCRLVIILIISIRTVDRT